LLVGKKFSVVGSAGRTDEIRWQARRGISVHDPGGGSDDLKIDKKPLHEQKSA
jgi:hypothetical protein